MFAGKKVVLSLLIGVFIAAVCLADGLTRKQYMELLEGGVAKAAARGERTVMLDPYAGLLRYRAPSQPRVFAPIEGLDTPEAVPFLIDVIKQGPGAFPHLGDRYDDLARCYAALALGAIRDPRGFQPLAQSLTGEYREGAERPIRLPAFAARAVALLGDYRAVDPLIEAMHHEAPRVRAAAAAGLWRLLGKPMDALAAAVDDPEMRSTPRSIWGRLLGRCLEVYEQELRHADPARRGLAASSLAIYLKEPLKRLKSAESSGDQQVREAAQKALAEIRAIVGPAEKQEGDE